MPPSRVWWRPTCWADRYFVGAAIAAVSTALATRYITRRGDLRSDTSIGVLFAGMFALGIFLFSTIRGYVGDLFAFLVGNVLAISPTDLVALVVLAIGDPGHRRGPLEGAAVRHLRPVSVPRRPGSRWRLGVPVPGPGRDDHRHQPPGGGHHPGGGHARHATRGGPAADRALRAARGPRRGHQRGARRWSACTSASGSTSPAVRPSSSPRPSCSWWRCSSGRVTACCPVAQPAAQVPVRK